MTELERVLAGQSRWAVLRGDALLRLGELPSASVQAVITDPPYSSGGLFRSDRARVTSVKYIRAPTSKRRFPGFEGDSRDQRSFLQWCTLWLSECLRVAEAGASLCVFSDWRQLSTMIDAVQCGGWVYRGIVPWDKKNARPVRGGFRAQAEYVVWATKGARVPRDVYLPGVIGASVERGLRRHQTQKPQELLRQITRICPDGGVVLDPFCGSGSTGVAALEAGNRFIGIEQSAHYVDEARLWLRAQNEPLAA